MRMLLVVLASVVASSLACELVAPTSTASKSPGDNFYRVLVSADTERYVPGQRYVVTLVGSRTHDVVQQFTRFKLQLDPLDPSAARTPKRQGEFQLFADTLTTFDEECMNVVMEADDLPKTEVQVMWKAPPAGSGCVLIKALVFENPRKWYAEDGQLTKRICEDTSGGGVPECCACDDAKYKMIFQGLWSARTHPKDYPVKAQWLTHFSDVIGATHPRNFTFWGEGEIATDGFRSLAEWGSGDLLSRELREKGGILRSIVKANGLWYPKVNTNTSATFIVDRRRHYVSLASMFGPSPDWVVGVSSLNLCRKDCSWEEYKEIDLYPYDAGTDNGISYLSPNEETVPREKMYKITTMYPEDPRAPFYNPGGEIAPLARMYLVRESLISRSCDEETLQLLVAEEAENSESVNRPECAVKEWGPWSPCSVSCGKGLRMRSREYRTPQKAQMFSCDRQVVSKEMCVADVPECEGDGNPSENNAEGAVENIDGVCETTEWGPWSECSVTCGVGMNTRRRTFLDHMGLKKCPSVHIEENRKCMEPPCTEQETDISDPSCPTTEWSAWSPCTASCGKGVKSRMRLLLVPADMQQDCSSKVELMQQRPCMEKEDCTIDMATAKKICMLEADQGPCRGLYQRWTFVPMKGMCIPFQYGGCRGNRNNFLTQDECMNTCQVVMGAPPSLNLNAANPDQGHAPNAKIESNFISPPKSLFLEASNRVDCEMSAWSEWSSCSVTCGSGYQERVRTILRGPSDGGAPCPARKLRRRRCFRQCSPV